MNPQDTNDMDDSTNALDPTQRVFLAMAVLDSQMQTLHTKFNCVCNTNSWSSVKIDNQNYEKAIADEKAAIEKMEEKINELSKRKCKTIANIDNLRQTKKFLEETESSIKHQLVMNSEKNEEHKITQRNLLMKYTSIANEYHEWKILHNEIIKKRIEVNRLKKEYSDYVKKLNLFESIRNQRVQVTIVAFVKLLVERQHEKELKKRNFAYEKQIEEEIAQLEQRKKELSEQIATKAKDTVVKIRERSFYTQTRFIPNKVASGNKPGSALSIKERLGLINLTFHKPSVNLISYSSSTNNVQPELNLTQVIPTNPCYIQDEPRVSSGKIVQQPAIAVTDETQQQSNSTTSCTNTGKPSPSAKLVVTEETFHKPSVNLISNSSSTDNVQSDSNSTQVIPTSPCYIQDEPEVSSGKIVQQPATAVTDQTQQKSNSTTSCTNTGEPSPSAKLEVTEKDMIINKESEVVPDEIIQSKPANIVSKEIIQIVSPTINEEIVMKRDYTAPVKLKQIKKGIKRLNNLLNKSEIREVKKIRRVSFKTKTLTSELSNFEENISRGKSTLSQPQTIIAEDGQSENIKSPEQDPPSLLPDNQSQEDAEENSSQEIDAQSIALPGKATFSEFNASFDSANYNIGEDNNNQQGSCTPQISSYFSSPAFGGQERPSQPFDQTPNNSRADTINSIFNLPMNMANAPISLSPPFSKTHTSEGNKTLESFFGCSSGGEKKSKNFFELF